MTDFPYEFGAIIVYKGIGFFDCFFWEKFQVLKKDFKSKSKSKNCWIFGFFKSTDQILCFLRTTQHCNILTVGNDLHLLNFLVLPLSYAVSLQVFGPVVNLPDIETPGREEKEAVDHVLTIPRLSDRTNLFSRHPHVIVGTLVFRGPLKP